MTTTTAQQSSISINEGATCDATQLLPHSLGNCKDACPCVRNRQCRFTLHSISPQLYFFPIVFVRVCVCVWARFSLWEASVFSQNINNCYGLLSATQIDGKRWIDRRQMNEGWPDALPCMRTYLRVSKSLRCIANRYDAHLRVCVCHIGRATNDNALNVCARNTLSASILILVFSASIASLIACQILWNKPLEWKTRVSGVMTENWLESFVVLQVTESDTIHRRCCSTEDLYSCFSWLRSFFSFSSFFRQRPWNNSQRWWRLHWFIWTVNKLLGNSISDSNFPVDFFSEWNKHRTGNFLLLLLSGEAQSSNCSHWRDSHRFEYVSM